MEYLYKLASSVIAGIMIGVGGLAYLSCSNIYIGSIWFSIGLLTILIFKLDLFTGKAGYILNGYGIKNLIIIWFGNFMGTYITSICKNTRLVGLQDKVNQIMMVKESDTYFSLFILGIWCGLLMFIAVNTFNTYQFNFATIAIIIFCVSAFIIIGFEHCIADMFYMIYSNSLTFNNIIRIIVISCGNVIGCNIIPIYKVKEDKRI